MSSFALGKVTGIIFGILIGLIICLIFFKLMNKNGKLKTDYDERQEALRDKGYKYGFWTLSALLGVLIILDVAEVVIPIIPMVLYFSIFFIGAVVSCVYCIWTGAYFGLNNVKQKWYIFMTAFAIFNFAIAINGYVHGEMIVDGVLQFPFINVLCGMMFLTVLVASLARKAYDKKQESEAE